MVVYYLPAKINKRRKYQNYNGRTNIGALVLYSLIAKLKIDITVRVRERDRERGDNELFIT